MRSSKDRTIEKKRRNKATKAQKTEASRRKRLANKAKREEIHAVNPDVKITMVDGVPRDPDGKEIELINGIYTLIDPEVVESVDIKIQTNEQKMAEIGMIPSSPFDDYEDAVVEYQETIDNDVIDNIKTKNKSALERLTDRFKKKKIEL